MPFNPEGEELTEAEALEEGRLIVQVFDPEGELVERFYGASRTELLARHRAGECSSTCSWCHQELAEKIGEAAAVAAMYERCFGEPMPAARN